MSATKARTSSWHRGLVSGRRLFLGSCGANVKYAMKKTFLSVLGRRGFGFSDSSRGGQIGCSSRAASWFGRACSQPFGLLRAPGPSTPDAAQSRRARGRVPRRVRHTSASESVALLACAGHFVWRKRRCTLRRLGLVVGSSPAERAHAPRQPCRVCRDTAGGCHAACAQARARA